MLYKGIKNILYQYGKNIIGVLLIIVCLIIGLQSLKYYGNYKEVKAAINNGILVSDDKLVDIYNNLYYLISKRYSNNYYIEMSSRKILEKTSMEFDLNTSELKQPLFFFKSC